MKIGIMSSQNNASTAGGGGVGSHLYWRINITATDSTDAYKAQIHEMEYRATIGGADQATGGTATSSSNEPSAPPANAFDDSNGTFWVSESGAALPQWLQYQFASAVEVAQISITSGDQAARAARAPKDFTIQFSDDGSSWTIALTVTGEPAWGITETRLYTI